MILHNVLLTTANSYFTAMIYYSMKGQRKIVTVERWFRCLFGFGSPANPRSSDVSAWSFYVRDTYLVTQTTQRRFFQLEGSPWICGKLAFFSRFLRVRSKDVNKQLVVYLSRNHKNSATLSFQWTWTSRCLTIPTFWFFEINGLFYSYKDQSHKSWLLAFLKPNGWVHHENVNTRILHRLPT